MGVPVGRADDGELVGLPVGFFVGVFEGELVGPAVVGTPEGA